MDFNPNPKLKVKPKLKEQTKKGSEIRLVQMKRGEKIRNE